MLNTQRLIKLAKKAQKTPRSKADITATFKGAGIINREGKLKKPYINIYLPGKK